jgi:hypothetical protein
MGADVFACFEQTILEKLGMAQVKRAEVVKDEEEPENRGKLLVLKTLQLSCFMDSLFHFTALKPISKLPEF